MPPLATLPKTLVLPPPPPPAAATPALRDSTSTDAAIGSTLQNDAQHPHRFAVDGPWDLQSPQPLQGGVHDTTPFGMQFAAHSLSLTDPGASVSISPAAAAAAAATDAVYGTDTCSVLAMAGLVLVALIVGMRVRVSTSSSSGIKGAETTTVATRMMRRALSRWHSADAPSRRR
ncbi:hypothetical protein BC828DRAFT_437113 [Blastocladiella britannica]|nr:hypothetical protein BC828DRAFT_437113 [Blastocladiella britannica]